MSMLEFWFKQSLIYRMFFAIVEIVNHSFFARAIEFIGRVLINSKIASCLRFVASYPYKPRNSMFIRAAEYFNEKSMRFRDRMQTYLKFSWIYRVLSNSWWFHVISILLVPAVAFYAVIDEAGRAVFKDIPLFGFWDEAYLIVCAIYVFLNWLLFKRKPLNITPVSAPMFILISVTFYLFLNNSLFSHIGFDGFRMIAQYVLWFFILNSFFDDDNKVYLTLRLLVYTGGFMGIHGLYQYIKKVPTPVHWTDAAEGTTATRVFSIVESPNILGSIFTLIIPICLALVLQRRGNFLDRAVYFMLFGAMGLSLILTLSRGAWLGAAVAMFVFCLAVNPRWLLILFAGGSSVLLIPSVLNRIQYLLSPQYLISSLTGGRLMRYQIGIDMFRRNFWFGVGPGHFGGAVAMNNRDLIPDTFYMDNYWLKTAVEMGFLGLVAYGLLMISLILWSIRSIKYNEDYDIKLVISGGFAGLCGIITHNLVENVFEVPYMVVYFWTVAAAVLYFGLRRRNNEGIMKEEMKKSNA